MSDKEANCAGTHARPMKTMRGFFPVKDLSVANTGWNTQNCICITVHHSLTGFSAGHMGIACHIAWRACLTCKENPMYSLRHPLAFNFFAYTLILCHFLAFCSNCPKTRKETRWCHLWKNHWDGTVCIIYVVWCSRKPYAQNCILILKGPD